MDNVKLMFSGRLISKLGDSLYSIAIIWYVFNLTKDPFMSSAAAAIITIPMVLSAFVGPLIDHFNRKKIMLFAQIAQMIIMISISIMIYFNILPLWSLLTSFFIVSMLEIFEYNAESAMTPMIMDEERLVKFNSYMATASLVVSLLTKALCIGIILRFGIETIYFINAVTFVMASLLFLKIKYQHEEQGKFNSGMYRSSIMEGVDYFKKYRLIWFVLPLMICNFTGSMLEGVLPDYTFKHGGETVYGYYLMVQVIFTLIGTLIVPKIHHINIMKLLITLPIMTGLLFIANGFITNLYSSIFIFGLACMPIGMINIILGTYFQTQIDNRILARIGTIANSLCTLTMPFGALAGGGIAHMTNSNLVMVLSGVGFIVMSILFIAQVIGKKEVSLSSLNEN